MTVNPQRGRRYVSDREAYVKALTAMLGDEMPITNEWTDYEVRDYVKHYVSSVDRPSQVTFNYYVQRFLTS